MESLVNVNIKLDQDVNTKLDQDVNTKVDQELVNTSFKVHQDRLTCCTEECSRPPVYGLLFGKAIHCKKHRATGYIDVMNKRWLGK